MLFDINGYQWYITCSGCATETCDARSRWSSMRGLHFFMPVSERKYYMAKNFLTYEQQLHILEYDKQLAIPNHEYATKKLEELSYYSLIGGYKSLFKHAPSNKYIHALLLMNWFLSTTLMKSCALYF